MVVGFKAKVDFEESLKRMIECCKEQERR